MAGPTIPGLWMLPATLGLMLIGIGLIIFVWPEVLAFVVASFFVVAGVSVMGSAWRLRGRVRYRRFDGSWSEGD